MSSTPTETDEIEARGREGQAVLVALNPAACACEGSAGIGGDDIEPALPQPPRQGAVAAAEIERRAKLAADEIEPVEQLVCGAPVKIVGGTAERRRPVAAQPPQHPVERTVLYGPASP